MPGPRPCNYCPFIFCIVGRGLDRLTAHNERRQPAKLARSCGCLPCRGKHCSLPDFAPLNRGPTLTTPHLRGASRTPPPTNRQTKIPVRSYRAYREKYLALTSPAPQTAAGRPCRSARPQSSSGWSPAACSCRCRSGCTSKRADRRSGCPRSARRTGSCT